MQLAMSIDYAGGYEDSVRRVLELESAGLDVAWVAEAYSFDAVELPRVPRGEDVDRADSVRASSRSTPARRRCSR